MSHRSHPIVRAIVTLVLLGLALPALAAKGKGRQPDLITTAPDFASYAVRSIAMLPVATYDNDAKTERTVAGYLAQNLRETGHRWISPRTARDILQTVLGDSIVKAAHEQILEDVRVDSLTAPLLCSALRADAVLCVRVDQWEQLHMLWNQAGKPSTTIILKAALVDSAGGLLWSASGSETGEGPYHDPSTNPIGVASAQLENTPITGQGGPPPFEEVLNRMVARWAARFPRPGAEARPEE